MVILKQEISLFSFHKRKPEYLYEKKKRSTVIQKKDIDQPHSIKKRIPKRRKRYGQNDYNLDKYLRSKKSNKNKKYISSSSSSFSSIEKKKLIKKENESNVNEDNGTKDSQDSQDTSGKNEEGSTNDSQNISGKNECDIIEKIMLDWGFENSDLPWKNISEDIYDSIKEAFVESFSEDSFKNYPCCYQNSFIVCESNNDNKNENNIVELNFEDKFITGNIPKEIGDFPKLRKLFLGSNNFSGIIPEEIGNLKNLEYLWLYFNSLNGTIPESIGNLSNLKSLNLHSNILSGEIPNSIEQLTELETLDLHGNELEGNIPDLSGLKKLKRIYVNENHLSITEVSKLIPTSVEYCRFNNNTNEINENLSCTSAAVTNISLISFQGILIFIAINIFLLYKTSLF